MTFRVFCENYHGSENQNQFISDALMDEKFPWRGSEKQMLNCLKNEHKAETRFIIALKQLYGFWLDDKARNKFQIKSEIQNLKDKIRILENSLEIFVRLNPTKKFRA